MYVHGKIMHEVKLIQETHQYLVDGKPCNSTVTTELNKAGLSKYWNKDKRYKYRGTAVHVAAHLIDRDNLDWDTVSPDMRGFLDAFLKFKTDTGIKFEFWETPLYDPIYKFCGTPDCFFPLVDIKTGVENEVQLGGYWRLLEVNGYKCNPKDTFSLKLMEDGKYIFTPIKDIQILSQVFLSALIVNRYKENNK